MTSQHSNISHPTLCLYMDPSTPKIDVSTQTMIKQRLGMKNDREWGELLKNESLRHTINENHFMLGLCLALADIEARWSNDSEMTVPYTEELVQLSLHRLKEEGHLYKHFHPKFLKQSLHDELLDLGVLHRRLYFNKEAYFRVMSAKNYIRRQRQRLPHQVMTMTGKYRGPEDSILAGQPIGKDNNGDFISVDLGSPTMIGVSKYTARQGEDITVVCI